MKPSSTLPVSQASFSSSAASALPPSPSLTPAQAQEVLEHESEIIREASRRLLAAYPKARGFILKDAHVTAQIYNRVQGKNHSTGRTKMLSHEVARPPKLAQKEMNPVPQDTP